MAMAMASGSTGTKVTMGYGRSAADVFRNRWYVTHLLCKRLNATQSPKNATSEVCYISFGDGIDTRKMLHCTLRQCTSSGYELTQNTAGGILQIGLPDDKSMPGGWFQDPVNKGGTTVITLEQLKSMPLFVVYIYGSMIKYIGKRYICAFCAPDTPGAISRAILRPSAVDLTNTNLRHRYTSEELRILFLKMGRYFISARGDSYNVAKYADESKENPGWSTIDNADVDTSLLKAYLFNIMLLFKGYLRKKLSEPVASARSGNNTEEIYFEPFRAMMELILHPWLKRRLVFSSCVRKAMDHLNVTLTLGELRKVIFSLENVVMKHSGWLLASNKVRETSKFIVLDFHIRYPSPNKSSRFKEDNTLQDEGGIKLIHSLCVLRDRLIFPQNLQCHTWLCNSTEDDDDGVDTNFLHSIRKTLSWYWQVVDDITLRDDGELTDRGLDVFHTEIKTSLGHNIDLIHEKCEELMGQETSGAELINFNKKIGDRYSHGLAP